MLTFHHSASEASLASSAGGGEGGAAPDEPVLDSGIKLPPGAEVFPVEVLTLHPTQLAVGMQQVHDKMAKVRRKAAKGKEALDAWLRANPIPVVVGPGQVLYLIDHHHLARALHESGVKTCYAGVARDFSALAPEAFWREMAAARCLWPHRHDGTPVPPEEVSSLLPNTVAGLQDDPYRSLAALVRKAGGFQKSTKPFSEFMWANFLRPRVPLAMEGLQDVTHFVGRGISHAMSEAASHLPGHTLLTQLGPEQMDLMAALGGLAPDDDDDELAGLKAKGSKKDKGAKKAAKAAAAAAASIADPSVAAAGPDAAAAGAGTCSTAGGDAASGGREAAR